MTEPRLCANEKCRHPIPESRGRRSIYCDDTCRKRVARRRHQQGESRRTPPPSVESETNIIDQERKSLEQREQAAMLRSLGRSAAKRQQYVDAIASVLTPYEPSTPVESFFEDEPQTNVDWALHFTDWHVGQQTKIEHTGFIYEQTTEITRLQVEKIIKAVFDIHHEASGKRVRRIWIPFTGDGVEGDSMRPSQLRGIDMAVTKQTVVLLDLLSWAIRSLLTLPDLEGIDVDMVGGNHDRTTSRPGNAGLGESDYVDTYAWLVGEMLIRAFENEPRVNITNWETFFGYREFAGLRHVFEHGASIKGGGGYGGVPWYPIHNRARLLDAELGGVDCVWFGHWHIPYMIPLGQGGWAIGGGALPATTTYVQSKMMKSRIPTQMLAEFHREHGLTKMEPLYAPIGLRAPGDVWNDTPTA